MTPPFELPYDGLRSNVIIEPEKGLMKLRISMEEHHVNGGDRGLQPIESKVLPSRIPAQSRRYASYILLSEPSA